MKRYDHSKLLSMYDKGKTADQKHFEEVRSNYLLFEGTHWKRIEDKLTRELSRANVSDQTKIRAVKNYIQLICKIYINGIVSEAPGVQCTAFNPKELSDQKNAELNQSVWADAEDKLHLEEKQDKFATAFVVAGEMFAFIYFNPIGGKFKGYEQAVDESGMPLWEDESGQTFATDPQTAQSSGLQPKAGTKAIFEGKLCIDMVHGFNVTRAEGCDSFEDSPFINFDEMVDRADLKLQLQQAFQGEELDKKIKYLENTGDEAFKIFDTNRSAYTDGDKSKVLVRKMFFKPCADYPLGWYSFFTSTGVLFDGELPLADKLGEAAFPIVWEMFDEVPTNPRGKSIVKPIRSPQANINQLISQKIQHAIVMGDDKIITSGGAKISQGALLPGLREIKVTGEPPTVMAGRAGDQFDASIEREVADIFKLSNLEMELEEKGETDPTAMLYKNMRQRKKYALYVSKYERFWIKVAEKYLQFAKHYLEDDVVIRSVGKREAINIAEFKNSADEGYQIKLKPLSKDLDSMFGQLMSIRDILQYGGELPVQVKGQLIKNMPFLNKELPLDELTLEDDNVTNDILAMDRGEWREPQQDDDHAYYAKRLGHRMKQSDFKMLPPQVQQMYVTKKQFHQQMEAERAAELKRLESQYIPTGGALVTCSIHVPDPKNPSKTMQLRLPYDALMTLVKQLESQGTSLDQLQMQDQQTQLEILQQANQLAGVGQGPATQPAPMLPQAG